MRKLEAIITQDDTRIRIGVRLDDSDIFTESLNFCDVARADGNFADLFHHLTLNRYKESTKKLPELRKMLKK